MQSEAKVSEKIPVGGMSCGHCVERVRKALEGLEGVEHASVGIGAAEVTWDPARLDRESVVAAIRATGYSAD